MTMLARLTRSFETLKASATRTGCLVIGQHDGRATAGKAGSRRQKVWPGMLDGCVLPSGLTLVWPGANWLPCIRSVDRTGERLGTQLVEVT